MIVNARELAKGIQAVKQSGQKAIGVSVRKRHLMLRGASEDTGLSLTWQQALADDMADVGEMLVEHKVLAGILKAIPGEVNVDLSDEGIHLSTCEASWKINPLGALNGQGDQLPDPLPVSGKIKLRFDFPVDHFREIVKLLAASAATDSRSPVLQTVLIAHDGQRIVACATDTYRLRVLSLDEYWAKGEIDSGAWVQVAMLPVAALKAAASAVAKLPKSFPGPVRLQLRSKAWTVSCGPIRLVAGYHDGEYPNVHKVIPSPDGATWVLTTDATQLRRALTALGPIAVSNSNRVLFDWQGGQVVVLKAVAGDDSSEAEVRLPCGVECEKKTWRTAWNYRYLLDGIAGRTEELTIMQQDILSPYLLDFGAEGLCVLMPMVDYGAPD